MRSVLAYAARRFYLNDRDCPLTYEPSGEDFLSPCLGEADFMRRVLGRDAFAQWLSGFLPGIPRQGFRPWLLPAVVVDRADPKLAHTDGLNLSRAWMLEGIAHGLPPGDRRIAALLATAKLHRDSALPEVTGEHYVGGHWLGTFAIYLTSGAGLEVASASSAATRSSSAVPTLLNRRQSAWARAGESPGRRAPRIPRVSSASEMTPRASAPMISPDSAQCSDARVDEQLRSGHRLIVGFAHVRRECSHQIHMLACSEPRAEDQGLSAKASRSSRCRPSARRPRDPRSPRSTVPAAPATSRASGRAGVSAPDLHLANRANGGVAFDEMRRQAAGADHGQPRGVGAAR